MEITHEFLSGIIENNGFFKIDQVEDGFVFKFIIVNNDIQLLYAIKKLMGFGKVINGITQKIYITNRKIEEIINFLKHHPIKTKLKRLEFERWLYIYTNIVKFPGNLKSKRCTYKIIKRLKYFNIFVDKLNYRPEIFKENPNYKNYLISNYGRVYSKITKKTVRGSLRDGYLRMHFSGRQVVSLNRLVLDTFQPVENSQNLEVRHYPDPNMLNNNLWNLRWGSHRENSSDEMRYETFSNKLLESDVIEIKNKLLNGGKTLELAKEFNISPSIISRIKNERIWRGIGPDLSNIKNNFTLKQKIKESDYPNIKELIDDGMSVADVAKQYGVSRSSMFQFIKQYVNVPKI